MTAAWTPDLAVGVHDIDEQHQAIFRHAQALADAVASGRGALEITTLLGFLAVYVVQHFRAEEDWMRMDAYPGEGPHQAEHARFAAALADLENQIDDAGHLYGVAYDVLYRIEPDTARVWQAATMEQAVFGLTCVSDGRLVGTGDGVYIIDPETGAIQEVVGPGRYETSGDIVGLSDGLLYWTVRGGDLLVVVDPDSGATTVRGDIGVEKIFGLGYSDGSLYGFTSTGSSLAINPSSGKVDTEASLPGEWWGATTNPVLW